MDMDLEFDDIIACLSEEMRGRFLSEASKSTNVRIRYEVAKSFYTPDDILSRLLNDGDFYVHWALVENSNTSDKIIAKLTTDENEDVREMAKDELKRRRKQGEI